MRRRAIGEPVGDVLRPICGTPALKLGEEVPGQDFKYEKTKEGFKLSRWTNDPKGDKTYQFEFKVK